MNQDQLTSFYVRRHPRYDGLLSHWEFCEETYEGGRGWFEKHIHRFYKEGDNEFADRKERAYRFNHTREAVDLVQKYLFKSPAKRNAADAPARLRDFWKCATRAGQGIDELIRLVSTRNSLVGRVALVIDSSIQAPEEGAEGASRPLSVREAEERRDSIYAYVVGPRDILDYAWSEEDGELLWIKLREYYRDDANPHLGDGVVRERIRLWTRDYWELYDVVAPEKAGESPTVRLKKGGVHGLGKVPVKLCDHSITADPYNAAGLVDDIAYLDRAVGNYLSNLDAIIQDQTFSQLAIPAQSLPGDVKSASNHMIEMGTKRVFTYDGSGGTGARPEFISPDPKQAGVILNVINKIINEIYSTVGLAGERTKQDNAVGIDNSSGVAKAYDFQRVNSLLLSKAARLQSVEDWIVETVLNWAGETQPVESLVTYPTTFDVASLGDELVTAEALQKVQAPIEVRREQMRAIVEKLLPQITDAAWERLMTAVDGWTDVQQKQAEAQVDQTKAATEATLKGAKEAPADPSQQKSKTTGKPVAANNRQGSVTPETSSTPKNSAK